MNIIQYIGSMTKSFSGTPLTTFMDVTGLEIRNINCHLQSYVSWNRCIAELVPTVTDIVNMSLSDSLVPKSLKTAPIRPLLKKTGLDSDILKKIRPIYNLTFISSHWKWGIREAQ